MAERKRGAGIALAIAVLATCAAAQTRQFRYEVKPGSSISVINEFGPLTLTASSGSQVIISAVPSSKKVEIDGAQNGRRIQVTTHFLQKAGPEDGRVEYQIQVPLHCSVSLRSASGPITVRGFSGDITVEGENASIAVQGMSAGDLRVHTITGAVTLADVHGGHLEVASISGDVSLDRVSGSAVSISTTGGAIRYSGSFEGSGDYAFATHSGNIEVGLAPSASVELTAHSVTGAAEDDFHFQPEQHPTMVLSQGHSFAGTANRGASSVRLRSFSGKIQVKKM